jgi:hypothetical protein
MPARFQVINSAKSILWVKGLVEYFPLKSIIARDSPECFAAWSRLASQLSACRQRPNVTD